MTALYRPQVFFYPRSPCGERLVMMEEENMILDFSIHALLAESDGVLHMDRWLAGLFLSTLSLRRATALSLPFGAVWIVFYPRSPCGERLLVWCSFGGACVFLSTLSLRRATFSVAFVFGFGAFSIHALLAESDL